MEELLRVGVISTTHGIHGEVKVFPTTEDPTRFEHLDQVLLDTGKDKIPLKIERVRYFKQMVILKLKGWDSINDVEQHRGRDLYVTRENALPLAEGEYYICDVIGSEVFTEDGVRFGVVEDILETGANDVYVIRCEDGKEVLFPSIPECILNVDTDKKRVEVHIMDGLL